MLVRELDSHQCGPGWILGLDALCGSHFFCLFALCDPGSFPELERALYYAEITLPQLLSSRPIQGVENA